MKKAYRSSETTKAPLSGAFEVNNLVFISGQIHADSEWNLQGETIEEKFGIIINNIKGILDEADLTLKDIVQVRIYVTDIKYIPMINTVYKNYFSDPLPACTALAVSALPLGADIEIEVVAARS